MSYEQSLEQLVVNSCLGPDMSPFDGVRQTRPKHVQAQKKAAKVGQSQTECDDVLD